MTSEDYIGLTIKLKANNEVVFKPNTFELKLEDMDIEEIKLDGSMYHCEEFIDTKYSLNMRDIFDYLKCGGMKKIEELKGAVNNLSKINLGLHIELKKYKDVIGELKK